MKRIVYVRALVMFVGLVLALGVARGEQDANEPTVSQAGTVQAQICTDPPCRTCPTGQVSCNSGCVSKNGFNSDPANCGRCDNVCGSGRCVGGVCASCPAGSTSCRGVCMPTSDFQTDASNCGGCWNVCWGESQCQAAHCAHTPPMCEASSSSVNSGFAIWNVSLHHRTSDNGVVRWNDMPEAVKHIAAVTWDPDDLIVVLPSAPSYYQLLNCQYDGFDFLNQLQSFFPGNPFTYKQSNDPAYCGSDSGDCVFGIACPWRCPEHPNNSGVIIGRNWSFVQSPTRRMYASNDPSLGGHCALEADYFGEYLIRHVLRNYTLRILAVQTLAADPEVAGRQILDAANWSRNSLPSIPTLVIGDFNGALGSSSVGSIRKILNVYTSSAAASSPPTCPGFSEAQDPHGPNFDGAMQIGVSLNNGQAPILIGFRKENYSGVMSAKLPLPNIAHSAEAVYFDFPKTGTAKIKPKIKHQ